MNFKKPDTKKITSFIYLLLVLCVAYRLDAVLRFVHVAEKSSHYLAWTSGGKGEESK